MRLIAEKEKSFLFVKENFIILPITSDDIFSMIILRENAFNPQEVYRYILRKSELTGKLCWVFKLLKVDVFSKEFSTTFRQTSILFCSFLRSDLYLYLWIYGFMHLKNLSSYTGEFSI
jgi:hypothetical protein